MTQPRVAGARQQGLRSWSPSADEREATRLILDGNQLEELTDAIGELTMLEVLDLAGNALTALPTQVVHLGRLRYLYLHDNRFTEIPAAVAALKHLIYLNVSGKPLGRISAWIGQLAGAC